MIKQTFNSLFEQTAEKFTREVRAGKYKIPAIEKGQETFSFNVDDTVFMLSGATRRGHGVIIERYMQNGFCYYVIEQTIKREKYQSTQRQKDIQIMIA